MIPLYRKVRLGEARGNAGLQFNKFVSNWPDDNLLGNFEGLGGPQKRDWVDRFVGVRGDRESLLKSAIRLKNLCEAISGNEPLLFITTSPFITGMGLSHPVENGFLWHHCLGVPYLPGSSVKGMIRSWVADWLQEDQEEIFRLFGRDAKNELGASAGNIIVFDALPVEPVELVAEVITPHDGGWRIADSETLTSKNAPADWLSPIPIPFLAVASGARFQFCLAARSGAMDGDLEKAYDYLGQALEWVGAGAKTAVGFGRMLSAEKLEQQELDAQQAQRKMRGVQMKAKNEAEKNIPPAVGQKAFHEDWGTVDILSVSGEKARIYSIDEAEEATVGLSELKKL